MNIQVGPLPADHERSVPSLWLPSFVRGTYFTQVPLGAFSFGNALMIASQTAGPSDPRGQLWYERGAGKLHIAMPVMRHPSAITTARQWLQVSPTREMLVIGYAAETAMSAGTNFTQDKSPLCQPWWPVRDIALHGGIADAYGLVCPVYKNTASHYSGGQGHWPLVNAWAGTLISSLATAYSALYHVMRVVDIGWVPQAFLSPSGEGAFRGAVLEYAFETSVSGLHNASAKAGNGFTITRAIMGLCGGSVASGDSGIVTMFHFPVPTGCFK